MVIDRTQLPADSLVLVTAANGLVASHVVDQLLAAGYRVRGTVRNIQKNAWMTSLFGARYSSDRFSLIEVPDMSAPKVWEACVQGVAGIAHMFGAADVYTQHYEQAVASEMKVHTALLEAARCEPSVKAFVFTSSIWAAWTPDASKESSVGEWTWNDTAVEMTRDGHSATPQLKVFAQYMALKTVLERQVWDYVRREKLPFAFSTILLGTVIGRTLQPKELGMPSTAGMVKWAYDGVNVEILGLMQPQWCVDTCDAAMLYVAALTTPGMDGERLFACGARYSWFKVVQALGQLFPDKNLPSLPDHGWDQTEVPNQRSGELLPSVKGARWASLEDSVKAGSECF